MQNKLIVWTELHETGIPIIDEQHRGIVSTINSLFYFMRKQRDSEVILPTLVMLEQYTKVHFLTEESFLELTKYPGLEEHRGWHKAFADRAFRMSLQVRKTGDAHDLLGLLKEWWTDHINTKDRKYTPYVLQGLRAAGEL